MPVKEGAAQPKEPAPTMVLVASFGSALAAEYAAQTSGCRVQHVDLRTAAVDALPAVSACVLFLKRHVSENELRALDVLRPVLQRAEFVAVVSSFRVHLDDAVAADTEAKVLARLPRSSTVVFRPGHVIDADAKIWRRRGFSYPLVPGSLHSCFVDAAELFAAIERERQDPSRRPRIITLLGTNRPVRDVLRERRTKGLLPFCLMVLCQALALLQVGRIAALFLRLIPSLQCWNVKTLCPRSFAELLALCNRHNMAHVKIVGYNNGVVHFGHRYPGKTVVSTVFCNRVRKVGPDLVKADCGTTIRQAMDLLAASQQELFVLPNYSYVCLGTALFVPIHGSASDFTTVAETITRALLYDPVRQRMILADSDAPAFRETVYHAESPCIVLRVWLRVKPKTRYFVQQETWHSASSDLVLGALRDAGAANVEIRKGKAASTQITVSKYYQTQDHAAGALEVPRDKLGRLWDRLEENPLTSMLMHAFARTMIWHVELFLTAGEFAQFWRTHASLPIRKIQLRHIRRDGLPHSPFRDHDCISVDLFMFRWHRAAFEAYLKQSFAVIRTNPGKHSQ
jgi:hypothetical protein